MLWRRYLPVGLVAVGGLLLSLIGFQAARVWQRDRTEGAFERRVMIVAGALRRGTEVDLEVLHSLRHHFEASMRVEREEFAAFTAGVLERHPELEALVWAPQVPEGEREEYAAAARREGIVDFQFTKVGPGGRPVPVGQGGLRYPAYYAEPMAGNQELLGLDLASAPPGRAAITQALRTGEPTATPWLPLLTGRTGFLIYLPVESTSGPPRFPEGAPALLPSFVVGIFRLDRLVEVALQGVEDGVVLTVADQGKAEQRLTFRYEPRAGHFVSVSAREVEDDRLLRRRELEVAGRRWELVFRPTPEFLAAQRTPLPVSILGGGLLATVMLVLYLLSTLRRGAQIAGMNEALLLEVRERRRAEKSVRFLSEAGETIASSLDYQITLRTIARLSVPTLADYCLIDVADDGAFRRLAVAHRDAGKEALLEEVTAFPPEPGSLLMETMRSGESALVREIDEELLKAVTRSPGHLKIVRALRPRSAMVVPLMTRGRKLGVMTLVASESGRRFGENDLELAEELGRRAAVAIDNARLYEETEAANKAKSDFLAVMSHELRTPLSAITGYADLLEMGVAGPLTPEQRTQVERIKANSGRQLLMIDEILTFSRLEGGRETVRREETDLGALARDAAAAARPLVEEKGLTFLLRLPEEPVEVVTDPEEVRHILLDLLSNAVKFTERGEVELSVGKEDDAAVFRVRDTGIGIAPEYQEMIFDPFFQVEESLTREKTGAGLGLAVARRLARLLGGDVTVESEMGKGSTFTLRLPIPLPQRAAA